MHLQPGSIHTPKISYMAHDHLVNFIFKILFLKLWQHHSWVWLKWKCSLHFELQTLVKNWDVQYKVFPQFLPVWRITTLFEYSSAISTASFIKWTTHPSRPPPTHDNSFIVLQLPLVNPYMIIAQYNIFKKVKMHILSALFTSINTFPAWTPHNSSPLPHWR